MLTRPIPSTGEPLPVIGLGTWKAFDVGATRAERAPLVDVIAALVDGGGTLIDSSPMYGRAESVVGDIVAERGIRDRVFLATKVWTTGRREGIQQMEDSMRKLRVEQLDLMQVHNLVDVDTHLDTLATWKREGRVRYVGITHYTASHHDAVAQVLERHDVDFLQINYSIGEREAEQRLLPLTMKRGVAVIANRPLGAGRLLKGPHGTPLTAGSREAGCDTWAELALKFTVSHPAITCVIPGTSSAAHMRQDLAAGTDPQLPDALRATVSSTPAR